MVSLGELIGNIAHQWRQPLAAITATASGMRMQKELDILRDEDIYTNCDDIVNSSNYLSETINEFKYLIKGDKDKKEFDLNETLTRSLALLKGNFNTKLIKTVKNFDENIQLYGFRNDLIQVIVNILKNSTYAFDENNIETQKLIFITTKKEQNQIKICIKDNAGGIQEDIMSKIFEPYFTTKHKSQGTGLGLYMTHQLVNDNLEGSIEVINDTYEYNNTTYMGAKLTIILPLTN